MHCNDTKFYSNCLYVYIQCQSCSSCIHASETDLTYLQGCGCELSVVGRPSTGKVGATTGFDSNEMSRVPCRLQRYEATWELKP